uniref:ATP synthase CF0 subunit I n=1 Tax=Scleria parvula TaxID=388579 RepID=UPI001F13BB4E|nr:ATP synthase CF0 subunit I [Scleria parvula]ULQ67657.1 ATP synthase CF0 subunit I [Scleria parvula]
MRNVTDFLVFLGHGPLAGYFGLNTDILATNLINLIVVIGVLIFFGKGVLNDLLDNRKLRILKTIQNSEESRKLAIKRLETSRIRLQKMKQRANEYLENEYSDLEREKQKIIEKGYTSLEQLENNKKETLSFEQEKVINEVRQQVLQQAFQRALETLNTSLNTELHFRTIRANIGILDAIE